MYPNNPDRIANSIVGIDWIIIAVTNRITKPEKNIRSIAFICMFLGLYNESIGLRAYANRVLTYHRYQGYQGRIE